LHKALPLLAILPLVGAPGDLGRGSSPALICGAPASTIHAKAFEPLVDFAAGSVEFRRGYLCETLARRRLLLIEIKGAPFRARVWNVGVVAFDLPAPLLVGRKSQSRRIRLASIGADHRHPWPLRDVLRLAPYLQPRSWIVLHDIQLGTYGKIERDAGRQLETGTPSGAEWLFDRWPFRKIRSFHIGAIELPARNDALIPFALELMQQPFEVCGKAAKQIRRALYQSFADLL
jgi:hypothetical protein